jgi:hypothetical protein
MERSSKDKVVGYEIVSIRQFNRLSETRKGFQLGIVEHPVLKGSGQVQWVIRHCDWENQD